MGNENRIGMNVEVLKDGAIIPTPAKGGAVDLYACLGCASVAVLPHKTREVPCGVSITIDDNYELLIRPIIEQLYDKSKRINAYLYPKEGNSGELVITLMNDGDFPFTISEGMRIAQGIVVPKMQVEINRHP